MGAFLVYIIKSSVCLALFYLFYRLLLSKETFHRFNRVALLGILMLSCVIPFIEVTVKEPTEVSQQFITLEELLLMAELNSGAVLAETTNASVPNITWHEILLMVYWVGILFFFFRQLWSLSRMLRLIYTSKKVKQENHVTLIVHQHTIAPFSWMKFVVISEKDLLENGNEILAHECAHIQKHHSIDLLVADICIFFQWFNPASWLLKQELQNIHEYEADESVINQGIDAKKYQLLLIKKAVGTRLYSMANSFNHSSLKKRITMMIKEKSNPWACLKYLYILPLAAVTVAAFARPEVSKELDEISVVKVNDLTAIVETDAVKSIESQPTKEVLLKGVVYMKDTKAPIAGVCVVIDGTAIGTVTDSNGNFTIKTADDATLSFTMVNCNMKRIKISETDVKKGMMVYLEKGNSSDSNGIAVVGYGKADETTQKADGEQTFQEVDQMPEYPGGMHECLKFLAKNVKYPAISQKNKVQGKVIVQFVVEKDGTITSPEVVRSADPYLDQEALRVITQMPQWKSGMLKGKPVRVKYTIPVTYKLPGVEASNDSTTNVIEMNKPANVAHINLENLKEKPLIIIDGLEKNYDQMKLTSSEIESMTVLKDVSATSIYGEKAKNGAILITTKQQK